MEILGNEAEGAALSAAAPDKLNTTSAQSTLKRQLFIFRCSFGESGYVCQNCGLHHCLLSQAVIEAALRFGQTNVVSAEFDPFEARLLSEITIWRMQPALKVHFPTVYDCLEIQPTQAAP